METIIEKKEKKINEIARDLGFKADISKYIVKFWGKKSGVRLILYAGLVDEEPAMDFYSDKLIMDTFRAKDKDINDFAFEIINAVKLRKRILKIVSK